MTYETARLKSERLSAAVDTACKALRSVEGVGSGPMGLTTDAVKRSKAYRDAKIAFDAAFKELRRFNAIFVKTYKKEIRDERKIRRDSCK